MQPHRGLETLFAALREAKILVGPREVLRVYEILARAEHLDRDGLHSILAAVLVKSREERQRFDEVFRAFLQAQDAFAPKIDDHASKTAPLPAPTNIVPKDKSKGVLLVKPRNRRRKVLFAVGVLGALMTGGLAAKKFVLKEPNVPQVDAGAPVGLADASSPVPVSNVVDAGSEYVPTAEELYPDAQDLAENFNDQVVTLTAVTIETPPISSDTRTFSTFEPSIQLEREYPWTTTSGLVAGLGLLAIVLAWGAWHQARRHKLLPPKAPPTTRDGPPELPLSAPATRGLELLDLRSEDALVWGVGKFVTEDATTNLDIDRTVFATAASGGRPELRFERRGRHRMVCLWIDESAKDPNIERFARELALALSRVGLDVDVARYWAVPDKLVRNDGTRFSPVSLEEDLALAIIAILTDGQALSMRHAGADRRPGIAKLLRMLARLPRLAVVDFGEGPARASRIAGAYGLATVRPDEAAAFLAMGRKPDTRDAPIRKLVGDATAWAAACALRMHPVDEETAYDVRRALGLSVSPWAWAMIRRSGRAAGDFVHWPQTKRAELLDWLRRAERGAEDGRVDASTLLGKTIAYWKRRLDAEAAVRAKNDAQVPWIGTPAERSLHIDRAFLDLWDRPEDAGRSLYSFVGTDAEALVKEKLRDFGPLEAEGMSGVIVLPWRFADLPDAIQAMLERIGFGGATWSKNEKREGDLVERRGRMWMGMGLACGLGIGAIVAGVRSWQTMTFPCVVQNVEGCGGWCEEVLRQNDGTRVILGGFAGFWDRKTATDSERPTLVFAERLENCAETTRDGWLIKRCGHDVSPAKPERVGDPRRSLYLVLGDPSDERSLNMANFVLDRRVADVVVVAKPPLHGELDKWFPIYGPGEHDRWVMLYEKRADLESIPGTSNALLKAFTYELSRPTRRIGLSRPPRQIWWDSSTEGIFVLNDHGRVTGIDVGGTAIERGLAAIPKTDRRVGPGKDGPAIRSNANDVRESGKTFANLAGMEAWRSWNSNGEIVVFAADAAIEMAQFGTTYERSTLMSSLRLAGPVVWSPIGNRFAGISEAGQVLSWNLDEGYGATLHSEYAGAQPLSLAWSISGNEILVGSEADVIMLWGNRQSTPLKITDQPVSSIVGPVEQMYVVTSTKAKKVFLVSSTPQKQQQQQVAPVFKVLREMEAIAGTISPNGKWLATVHETGKIRVATIDDDTEVNEFACNTQQAPVWSPDSKRLLAICGNKVIDTAAVPALFSIRTNDGKCVSRDVLEQLFGMRKSETNIVGDSCELEKKP